MRVRRLSAGRSERSMEMGPRRPAALLLGAVLACGLAVQAARINSFAGPYIGYAKQFYKCGDNCEQAADLKIRVTHFNPARPNELQRMTGFINFHNDFNDTLWGKVILDARSNNQWKENAFVFSMPKGCSASRTHIPDPFRIIFKKNNVVSPKCAVPAANYTFEDEPVKWVFPHFPVMPYGEYRFRMSAGLLGKAQVFCVCVECVGIPKV